MAPGEKLRGTFQALEPMTSSVGSWPRKTISCRLIYPRGIPLSAAMLGEKHLRAGCKWVFVRGHELISVLGFGKLVTSCHFAFSSSLSEQVVTDWQAFSEVEEDICVFTLWNTGSFQVTHLGKQMNCLLSSSCYGTNIHLMCKHVRSTVLR